MSLDKINLSNDSHDIDTVSNIEKSTHVFDYELNSEKTKKKVLDGARRVPYRREDKKGCTNLIFSDGAFNEVVLKSLIELKNGPKFFVIGTEEVERISIDPRKELSGKHVDTKLEFKFNSEKIVIHVYNSTQKLLIQGRKHCWFVENYLEPFFKIRISKLMTEIEQINRDIITTLDEGTLDEEAEILYCDKCDFSAQSGENLRNHICLVPIFS